MNHIQRKVIEINEYWIAMLEHIKPEYEGVCEDMLRNQISELVNYQAALHLHATAHQTKGNS